MNGVDPRSRNTQSAKSASTFRQRRFLGCSAPISSCRLPDPKHPFGSPLAEQPTHCIADQPGAPTPPAAGHTTRALAKFSSTRSRLAPDAPHLTYSFDVLSNTAVVIVRSPCSSPDGESIEFGLLATPPCPVLGRCPHRRALFTDCRPRC